MATWNQFKSIPNGRRIFNHGWDECVALANHYHEDVIGGSFVPVGSAYQWWTQFNNFRTLTSNYTRSNRPVPGAIFVSRYGIYNAAHGHIGVVLSVNKNGTFNTLEQNAGTWRYVGRYTRGMANVYGFLVPKKNPAVSKPASSSKQTPGGNEMFMIALPRAAAKGETLFAIVGPDFWLEFSGQAAANNLIKQITGGGGNPALTVSRSFWNHCKKAATTGTNK